MTAPRHFSAPFDSTSGVYVICGHIDLSCGTSPARPRPTQPAIDHLRSLDFQRHFPSSVSVHLFLLCHAPSITHHHRFGMPQDPPTPSATSSMAESVTPNTNGQRRDPDEEEGVRDTHSPEVPVDDEHTENGADSSPSPSDDESPNAEPPLPDESVPPLPNEAPPKTTTTEEDDGWQPVWEESAQAFYFYNSITGATTWTNPRVQSADATAPAPGLASHDRDAPRPHGGYDPAIHGDYDPTAPYAQEDAADTAGGPAPSDPNDPTAYAAVGQFNRFTGRWQAAGLGPEQHNDENKSRRQMSAFFDVDAAANSHDGRSLRAERAGKKLSRKELKAFKEKRRERKEEKRRAWLRD